MTCSITRMISSHGHGVLAASRILEVPRRTFLVFGSQPQDRSMSYKEQRLLGYSQEQMFNIASDVSRYKQFVPWCNESVVLKSTSANTFDVRLGVGFPPLSESYHSTVTVRKPGYVRSVAHDCHLFSYLINEWNFQPGLEKNPNTCIVIFSVDFEFKSIFYSKIAGLFFDQVVTMMINAFLDRARQLHGPPSIPAQKPKIILYKR